MKKISVREVQFLGSILLVLLLGIIVVFSQTEEKRPTEKESEAIHLEFPIDINKATERELEFLPGIGPAKAKAIIDFRNSVGGFNAITDLLNVKGIGEKTFAGFNELITVAVTKDFFVTKNEFNGLLNINSASLEELCSLPDIGQVKAGAIIDYRERNGSFEKTDDLTKVSGIGDLTLKKIESLITVGAVYDRKVEVNEKSKININTSLEERLVLLPGIGEVLASRITSYRDEHGYFKCPEDLLNVKGIGVIILDGIRELIEF